MKTHLLFAFSFVWLSAQAQDTKTYPDWQLKDPKANGIYGAGVDKAYELLKGKPSKQVIVAVIDAGIDINHEDLKANIWTNTAEIPDNGIDDDGNGYIDDIHGWNFLGGKNGNIEHESSELARLYHKLSKKYDKVDSTSISESQRAEYKEYQTIRAKFGAEQKQLINEVMGLNAVSHFIDKVKEQNKGVFNRRAIKKYKTADKQEKYLKHILKLALLFGSPAEMDKEIKDGLKQIANTSKYNSLNTDSIRRLIVGDDPDNQYEHNYGNNDVMGPDALHGTHVGGIIGAVRNNNLGINGIADNVKIMVLRAVPDGDERDKDIANAIRYAVDNHATIINMSFGKYYSPGKKVIDEAIQYAADHDVLLIHAAGNESKNKDLENSFPTNELDNGKVVAGWMEIGANDRKKGKSLLAPFSNYGKKHLDLFAPGMNIYSTGPHNTYINESGTSMAAPVTAGVAALIREYFPDLKAVEVKAILMKSVTPYKKKIKIPGTKNQKATLSDLSISGGILNAANAVQLLLKK